MPNGEAVRLFGTDGIRGVAGEFPLDSATLESIGQALADNLASELGRPPQIVIGRDTRESGIEIERWVSSGVQRSGASIASAGVITTPGVAYLTRSIPFDAGIVISASHNPFRDNGIKVFTPSGRKLADDVERRIEREVSEPGQRGNESSTPPAGLGDLSNSIRQETSYQQLYIDHLVSNVSDGLNLADKRIGIDCANGAASCIAPEVFERLGASVEVIFASPDGRNINENCGSLHQEALQRLVRDHRLDAGVSFDGDADRALFVDESGRQVDGDQMMLILADRMKKKGWLAGNLVVSTVMSNLGFEIALRDRGISLVRALVGDRYVLDELLAQNASL
ncbi:MAG TPA: phosphoglucosamine mutase, partial [Blastocatellia bacterium]|nr:phosphoglucosamine mutase [Blastocatellia bacterium]